MGGVATRVARVKQGRLPTFARCGVSTLGAACAREVFAAKRNSANQPPIAHILCDVYALVPTHTKPDNPSVFIVGGKPIWHRACGEVIESRTDDSRVVGGILGADSAELLLSPLAWGAKRTPSHQAWHPSRPTLRLGNF